MHMNNKIKPFIALFTLAIASAVAVAGVLDGFTSQQQVGALKTALTQSAQSAIGKLGVADGFLGNKEVKIPLPGKLQKAMPILKMLKLDNRADELVVAMNRAAEAAVPEARILLTDSVKNMSVTDAVGILTGGPDSATQYFRRTTSEKLAAKFRPIVTKSTEKVGAAKQYNQLAGQLAQYGILKGDDTSVEGYVTSKALDGLFTMMAKEEANIRANPLGQASSLVKKIFGALGH